MDIHRVENVIQELTIARRKRRKKQRQLIMAHAHKQPITDRLSHMRLSGKSSYRFGVPSSTQTSKQ